MRQTKKKRRFHVKSGVELKAAKQYSIRHKTAGINIKFHPGTTINQMIHECTFIKNNLLKDSAFMSNNCYIQTTLVYGYFLF